MDIHAVGTPSQRALTKLGLVVSTSSFMLGLGCASAATPPHIDQTTPPAKAHLVQAIPLATQGLARVILSDGQERRLSKTSEQIRG